MAQWAVQLAMVCLANSIRRLREGPVEREVRSAFLQAAERLQADGHLLSRQWNVWATDPDVFLWGVMQGDHVMAAVLRPVMETGFEVRILVDGRVAEARQFQGDDASEGARAFAAAKRLELGPLPGATRECPGECEARIR